MTYAQNWKGHLPIGKASSFPVSSGLAIQNAGQLTDQMAWSHFRSCGSPVLILPAPALFWGMSEGGMFKAHNT